MIRLIQNSRPPGVKNRLYLRFSVEQAFFNKLFRGRETTTFDQSLFNFLIEKVNRYKFSNLVAVKLRLSEKRVGILKKYFS